MVDGERGPRRVGNAATEGPGWRGTLTPRAALVVVVRGCLVAIPASFAAGAPPIAAEAQGGSVDAAAPAALGSDGQVKHAEAQAARALPPPRRPPSRLPCLDSLPSNELTLPPPRPPLFPPEEPSSAATAGDTSPSRYDDDDDPIPPLLSSTLDDALLAHQ